LGKEMSRILATFLALLIAGCANPSGRRESPHGRLLFSAELIRGAFSGVPTGKTGFFFFQDGESITCYHFSRGTLTDVTGGSFQSAEILRELEKIGFQPFSFEAELEKAATAMEQEAKREGKEQTIMMTFDGAEFEIRFEFHGSVFSMRRWNPGAEIDYYAGHSESIAKLKAVIDTFAQAYGRSKFAL
jgi:hypothetical protein